MYQQEVKTPEQAATHLFFHCCLQDGEYTEEELKLLSDKIVTGGLNKHLHFKEEIITYRAYYNEIGDQAAYIQFLVQLIKPVHKLALYSYCVELCLSDASLGVAEDQLLRQIAEALALDTREQDIATAMMIQRKRVEKEQQF